MMFVLTLRTRLLITVFISSISGNIQFHNEYETKLRKADPFIDGFVPTEYTSGFSKYQNLGAGKTVPGMAPNHLANHILKVNPSYTRPKRDVEQNQKAKYVRPKPLRRHYYLHENYLVGENVEVKILSPITTQPTAIDTYTSRNHDSTATFGNQRSQNKSSPATSLDSRITLRPPLDITKSLNDAAPKQTSKNSFLLLKPTASTKPKYVSHSHIEGNVTRRTDSVKYPHVTTDQNTSGDKGMSEEDSEMDLIARDIRHFDNYSNITAKSHQSGDTSTVSAAIHHHTPEDHTSSPNYQGTTEGRLVSNAADEDKNVDFSTVEEIRLKVNQYFRKLKGIGGPRVMELFKKLNTTLENPNSETKQTVFELFVQLVLQVEELKNIHHSSNQIQNMVSKNTSVSDVNSDTFPPMVTPTNTTNINMFNRQQRKNNVIVKDPKCENLKAFTILPNDSSREVRKKQASKMSCYMNKEVDPCNHFYEYACGRWELYHPIPKDRVGYDIFEILREGMDKNLVEMLKEPIKLHHENNDIKDQNNMIARNIQSPNQGSSLPTPTPMGGEPIKWDNNATVALKLLYASCMNEDTIEMRKEDPLQKLLIDEFGGWPVLESADPNGFKWNESTFDWQKTIIRLRQYNNDILVALWVGPDIQDSDEHIVQFDQSQLMLASAEYYQLGLSHPIMQTYYNILVNVATMMGAGSHTAKRDMKDLLEFEIQLAEIMIPPEDRRNYSAIYNKITLDQLQTMVGSGFNFTAYLDSLLPRKLRDGERVVMYALPYFKRLTKLLDQTNKRVVANYVLWRFIRHRIINLDRRYPKVMQELYRKLYGIEEKPPRWKFCTNYVRGNLGSALGSLYVKKYFDEHSKEDMELLTSEVQAVFQDFISTKGGWISEATKAIANEKIENIARSIGYPDSILNIKLLDEEVKGLEYKKDKFFENVLMNLQRTWIKEMSQLDKSVNRTHWTATPTDVNAYYSRNRNQIMFPAAILQPPFYHKFFPRSLNFGGIGVVIGHEITHGFDDKGRQFDQHGNIDPWWDSSSLQKFQNKAQCIIDQYGNYKVDEVDVYLNGINTQGENIADNGGIKQAFYAYKNWANSIRQKETFQEDLGEDHLRPIKTSLHQPYSISSNTPTQVEESNIEIPINSVDSNERLPGMESLSGDQLFFLNFAQVWCGSTRPEAMRSKLKTATHAPGKYRVLGTLSNSEEFSRAFNCPVNSKMNPTEKCSLW